MLHQHAPKEYCLVLSGGGAKGVYHIGVWKALKELGIEVNAFIGNSIGAIMAGFLVQGSDQELEDLGENIKPDLFLKLPDEFISDGDIKLPKDKIASFKKLYHSFMESKGIDTSPLRTLLNQLISETKIRKTDKDLGVVTFNISDFKSREVFIEDMEEGSVIDYIMASSAFPGFITPSISGKKYVDGAVHDNIPYNMARRRGYRRIIVSDMSGMGRKRKMDISGSQTIYIKNTINMGGIFDFDREFISNFTKLGYLDTKKTFGLFGGEHYFLIKDRKLESKFKTFLSQKENTEKLNHFVLDNLEKSLKTSSLSIKAILPKQIRYSPHWLEALLDSSALALKIEQIKEWTMEELIIKIRQQYQSFESSVNDLDTAGRKEITSFLRSEFKSRNFLRAPYYYWLAIDKFIPNRAKKMVRNTLIDFYPEVLACSFFLECCGDFLR